MERLSCLECKQLINEGVDGLSSHLKIRHGLTLDRGMGSTGFVCGQSRCLQNYEYFKNLRQNILTKHSRVAQVGHDGLDERGVLRNPQENNFNPAMDIDDHGDDEGIGSQANQHQNVDTETEDANSPFDLRSEIIKIICRLHACKSMTGAMIKVVLEEFEDLFHQYCSVTKEKVINRLFIGQVVTQNLVEDVNFIFDMGRPFEGLKNHKQQIQAIVTHSHYIEPLEILLGYSMDMKLDKRNRKYQLAGVPETFQYVPVIEVLRMILSNKSIREAIENERSSPNGIFGSFIVGENSRTHPFYQRFPHSIRLRLYYNELGITNPLGSKTGIHKLGVFYFKNGSLPEKMNSVLNSIHILAVFCYPDVHYGFDRILSPFFDDLARLESDDGVPLEYGDGIYILKASIESFCGDGAAVHAVNEFLGSAANSFCRLCTYSKTNLHQGSLQLGQPRTRELFDEHLEFLATSNYSSAARTATGLRGLSP
ncbi:hypothetical protein QAD02_007857 [Eretmocerus hayati]|uniref:Uncharacterized protein n=1 Tax=Eretmocerus hayati TaxID=131215 RepID=A0ACC2N969_9HYME|nr:hypothetical protein QAD02_007857 [Eretmocerus hayati]